MLIPHRRSLMNAVQSRSTPAAQIQDKVLLGDRILLKILKSTEVRKISDVRL
jgi:hypothetical protein